MTMRNECIQKNPDVYYINFSKFALKLEPKFSLAEYSYSQWCESTTHAIQNVPLKVLKHTLKTHGKPVSGNKPELANRLGQYYFQIKMAIRIQKTFRGFLVRESEKLRGRCDRTTCNNNTDFYTLEPITEIPNKLFFSYRDSNGFVYGFNMLSLLSMFKLRRCLVNPYNREDIEFSVLQRVFSIYTKSRILYPDLFCKNI